MPVRKSVGYYTSIFLTVTMFATVLWGSFIHHIESAKRARIAYCAIGYEILRFSRMNQMILSGRWSDSIYTKESNFSCIIQKDHFLFLLERSTSLLWPHKISYSAFLHNIFFSVQHSGSCLVILFFLNISIQVFMCKWDKDGKMVTTSMWIIYSMRSNGKKRIAIFICIHVQYELQSQVSIIEHHPQRN